MSAVSQKLPRHGQTGMSALPPKAAVAIAHRRFRYGPEAAFSFIPDQARRNRRVMRRPVIIAIAVVNQNLPSMELGENARTNRPCLSPAAKKREPNNKGAT
jgi:hypothetical protein